MGNKLPVHTSMLLFILLVTVPFNKIIAVPGDDLVITGSIVNLRGQASTDAPVLLKLLRDRRVVEIKREGEWVEVFIDRADISTGWIHNSLVAPLADRNNVPLAIHTESFNRFVETFNDLNGSWQQQYGYLPFISVEEFTNRRIRITATTVWLKTDQGHRQQMLSLIFAQWSNAVGSGLSIYLEVVDQDGDRHMSMFR